MAKKKQKSGINLNPEHAGDFRTWCLRQGYGGVTTACIQEGLRSEDPHVRQMANFARNARKWARGKRKR